MPNCSESEVLVAQSCLPLWDPMDCSLPGSSVHGILQARIPKWVAIPFSRGSSWPRDRTQISCIVGRFLTISTRSHQGVDTPLNQWLSARWFFLPSGTRQRLHAFLIISAEKRGVIGIWWVQVWLSADQLIVSQCARQTPQWRIVQNKCKFCSGWETLF